MRSMLPLAVLAPLALAACAGGTADRPGTAAATPFSQALASEYQAFADSELAQQDWADSAAFREKGRMAATGRVPVPDDPRNRGVGTGLQLNPDIDIGAEQRAEAIQGRERLTGALAGGAPSRNPQAAARAQVAYDCWVEQLEEGWQENDIERCRRAFNTAMGELEARPVAAAAQPAADLNNVYFAFDSAEVTPQGRAAIAATAREVKRSQAAEVTVVGHADRSGSDRYNEALSAERAEAVAQELAAQGIPANRIRTQAAGESDLEVPTPDGVPQPQNRRAVIEFD